MDDGNSCRFNHFARFVVSWFAKCNVVSLPLAWRQGGVGQWWILAIDGSRLTVGVGVGFVTVEYLDLKFVHQKNACVATILSHTYWRIGGGPFQVELNVSERAFCEECARAWIDFEPAIAEFPACRLAVFGLKFVERFSIKQDDGIGRWLTDLLGRFDDRWLWPSHRMLLPA